MMIEDTDFQPDIVYSYGPVVVVILIYDTYTYTVQVTQKAMETTLEVRALSVILLSILSSWVFCRMSSPLCIETLIL